MCCVFRRSYSLDVEVSASGFIKELEKDGVLLQPAGPESEDDDDEEEEDVEDEDISEEEEPNKTLDLEDYKHAMLELEGLKVSETNIEILDNVTEEESEHPTLQQNTETVTVKSEEETERDKEDELKEADDECPELTELSAFNKEYKPFR